MFSSCQSDDDLTIICKNCNHNETKNTSCWKASDVKFTYHTQHRIFYSNSNWSCYISEKNRMPFVNFAHAVKERSFFISALQPRNVVPFQCWKVSTHSQTTSKSTNLVCCGPIMVLDWTKNIDQWASITYPRYRETPQREGKMIRSIITND